MKLSDWAKKQGISYLTAYRWFKGGSLPVEAYQSDSGTIIVDDPNFSESPMPNNNQSNDSMSLFLKKTVEFSKNNSSVEDFAAYVLSNFSLKLNNNDSSPKYSKNKPKPEDVQKHFQKFLKPKGENLKPELRMFIADSNILEQLGINEEAGEHLSAELSRTAANNATQQDIQSLVSDLAAAISTPDFSTVTTYDSLGSEGVVSRNTLQSNYTSSTDAPFNSLNLSISHPQPSVINSALQPSVEDVAKAHQAAGKLAEDIRSVLKPKRGRKPSKKVENK
jgi:hypothetical protein